LLTPPIFAADDSSSTLVEEWGLNLTEIRTGPKASDAIIVTFELRSRSGELLAKAPPLIGPLLVSPPNREIFSCESNSTMGGEAALSFDLSASVVGSYVHPGYLRDCGLSKDERLYWLHYNLMENGKPYNFVVILGPRGKVILTRRLNRAGSVELTYEGRSYAFPIPEPDLPG
jgi:hypothetical protein